MKGQFKERDKKMTFSLCKLGNGTWIQHPLGEENTEKIFIHFGITSHSLNKSKKKNSDPMQMLDTVLLHRICVHWHCHPMFIGVRVRQKVMIFCGYVCIGLAKSDRANERSNKIVCLCEWVCACVRVWFFWLICNHMQLWICQESENYTLIVLKC